MLGEKPIGAPVYFLFLHYSFLKGLSWKSCLFQTSVRNPKAGDSKVPVVPFKVTEQILKLSEFWLVIRQLEHEFSACVLDESSLLNVSHDERSQSINGETYKQEM